MVLLLPLRGLDRLACAIRPSFRFHWMLQINILPQASYLWRSACAAHSQDGPLSPLIWLAPRCSCTLRCHHPLLATASSSSALRLAWWSCPLLRRRGPWEMMSYLPLPFLHPTVLGNCSPLCQSTAQMPTNLVLRRCYFLYCATERTIRGHSRCWRQMCLLRLWWR